MTKLTVVQEPPLSRFLFNDTRTAIVWFLLRLYIGWAWLDAGLHKIQDPAWMETGKAIQGFWTRAVAVPPPPARPPITYDWYRGFLQFLLESETHVWFGKLIAVGETLIGVALIIGIFSGFAALIGAFMNMNFMLAGTASSNPVLLILAIGILMAWKVAGIIGVDRFLLPALGTPWRPAPPERAVRPPSPPVHA
ncbi:MAG: DoxX family protein [Chloroflexota bacterium]